MLFHYYKYHALGNDYIVIDPNKFNLNITSHTIKLICDRNYGIGSDGILYGPIIEGNVMKLRIFNPDGSEAEKSGNGIRIFARYLLEANYISESNFILQTLGGKVKVEYLDPFGDRIKVDMGQATFDSFLIPVSGERREVVNETIQLEHANYQITCLSIGNPHCVVLLQEHSKELALRIGPLLENHPHFPNRINVQLLRVIDRHNIQIEIWERGAGYTMASGSSSCAAASAAFKLGLIENQVQVHMPGGVIDIEIKNEHVFMTGNVSSVARGEFAESFCAQIQFEGNGVDILTKM
ncbi:MAG: diaminopimelate epimerase [Bacilli bacterium]|nr:diaminopimelate epimerase [Bacilli bacterium]